MCLNCLKKEMLERKAGKPNKDTAMVIAFMSSLIAKEMAIQGCREIDYENWQERFKGFLRPLRKILSMDIIRVKMTKKQVDKIIRGMYDSIPRILNGDVANLAYLKVFTAEEINEALDEVGSGNLDEWAEEVKEEFSKEMAAIKEKDFNETKAADALFDVFRRLCINAIRNKDEERIKLFKEADWEANQEDLINFLMTMESRDRDEILGNLMTYLTAKSEKILTLEELNEQTGIVFGGAIKSLFSFLELLDDDIIKEIQAGNLFAEVK